MAEKQKTIADIIAEKRAHANEIEREAGSYPNQFQRDLICDLRFEADRLEAALKREKAEIEADALAAGGIVEAARHTPGNAAAMREACQKMRDLLMLRGDGMVRCVLTWDEFNESQKMLRAALSAPPRNCDVGTADDWMARFSVVCERCSGSDCDHRLFKDEEVCDCFARWAQMPYEEGGEE